MTEDFHRQVQDFVANALPPGATRKMVPKGALDTIRKFLKGIDLADVSESPSYAGKLDELTERLQKFSEGKVLFGVARKCLNLFFRDALYNHYLRQRFNLGKFEKYLEIPLDGNVGKGLRREKEGEDLPKWGTVKGLTREDSAKFQGVAAEVAKRKEIARVHLDLVYWRGGTADGAQTPTGLRAQKLAAGGYKGHKPGFRKGEVHEAYDKYGAVAARELGLKRGLKKSTLRAWFGVWKRESGG